MIKRNELKPSEKPAFRYGGDDSKILSIGVIQQLLRQKKRRGVWTPDQYFYRAGQIGRFV